MLTDAFMLELARTVARGFEIAGIAVIVLGSVLAVIKGLLLLPAARGAGKGDAEDVIVPAFRRTLGRAILTGLELMVAADIIRTVAVEPTLRNVLVLGLIVIIRTFLSFSLEVEIDGRWPWQTQAPALGRQAPPQTG